MRLRPTSLSWSPRFFCVGALRVHLLAATAFAGSLQLAEAQGWYSGDWLYRKALTIDGTQITGNLSNFPVLVSITDSDLSKARADGFDLLFTDEDGETKLDHEIEDFVQGSGTLAVWVRVSSLTAGTDKTLYLYYGNTTATDQQNATGVWDSAFKGVYHLHDDFLDSSANNFDGTNSGSIDAAGQVADAQDFDGVNDRVDLGTTTIIDPNAAFTLSAWVYVDTTPAASNHYNIFGRRSDVTDNNGILFAVGEWLPTNRNLLVSTYNGSWQEVVSTSEVPLLSWAHVAVAYDGTTNATLYLNGSPDGSAAFTEPGAAVGLPQRIGTSKTTAFNWYFDGRIDEVRLSQSARSSDWILTEFNNQNDPGVGGFLKTISAEATFNNGDYWYGEDWLCRKQICLDGAQISGTLSDFPALISVTDADLSAARSDGFDLLFTDNSGNAKLDHEIERFDRATGTLVAWVRVPTIQDGVDEVLYLNYDNHGAADQQNVTGVWDGNFKGVFHLHDDFLDSSTKNFDGTNNQSTDALGKVADGQDFDGVDDRIDLGTTTIIDPNEAFTVSSWVYVDTTPGVSSHHNIFGRRADAADANGFLVAVGEWLPSNRNLLVSTYDGAWQDIVSTGEVPLLGWSHVSVTYDGTTNATLHINGTPDGSGVFTEPGAAAGLPQRIGTSKTTAFNWHFDGKIDEVRLSQAARSSDWILTEYQNQNNPGAFLNCYGPQEVLHVALHPTGDGTTNTFTSATGCLAGNWDCVNDQTGNAGTGPVEPDDDTTSYLTDGNNQTNREMFSLDDGVVSAGGIITEIDIVAMVSGGVGAAKTASLSYQRVGFDGGYQDSAPIAVANAACCGQQINW
jgi:hypothetical protein